MHEEEPTLPEDYTHQLVVVESGECICNQTHSEGDTLWGGKMHPDNISNYDVRGTVQELHSVEFEYRKV